MKTSSSSVPPTPLGMWIVPLGVRDGLIESFLCLPPDESARESIFKLYLHELPIEKLDYATLAKQSVDFSGADIKGVVDRVSEAIIEEILECGEDLQIEQTALIEELKRSKPTTLEWFSSAKNVVEYANENGIYDELAFYMKEALGKKSKKMGFV